MALPLKTGADLYTQELIRARLQNFGGDLPEYGAGSIYFNTIDDTTVNSSNRIRYRGLRAWHSIATTDDIDALQKQLDELDFAGSEEFQSLSGRVLTIEGLFNNGKAKDAEKLGGQLPSYYAQQSALAQLRSEFDALEALLSDDTSGVIDSWNDVKEFLKGYSDMNGLEEILSAMNADIAKRALQSEVDATFATVNGNVSSIGTRVGSLETLTGNHTNQIADRYTKAETNTLLNAKADWFAEIPENSFKAIGYGYLTQGFWTAGPALSFGANSTYFAQLQAEGSGVKAIIKFRKHGASGYGDWVTLLHSDNYSDLVTTLNKQLTVPSIKIGGIVLDVVDGNLRISGNAYATGELGSGQIAEEGEGGAGGGYTAFDDSVTWADYDDSMADWLLTAYHGKLFNDRIATLENKATKVEVSNLLTSGTKIATIKVDANSYDILAPSTDWSAITNKPTTIAGYGITDTIKYNTAGIDISGDTMPLNQIGYGYTSTGWPRNAVAMSIGVLQNYWAQLQFGHAQMSFRTNVGGTISDWSNVLTNNNYEIELNKTYLRLIGGTINGSLIISDQYPIIAFTQNGVRGEGIGVNQGKLVCYNAAGTNNYEILHLNNYADYAAKKDGSNASGTWGINISGSAAKLSVNDITDGNAIGFNGIFVSQQGDSVNLPTKYGVGLQISSKDSPVGGTNMHWLTQLYSSSSNNLYYRGRINTESWSSWKQIAFTDSDITGNADTATKLKNSVNLWGNSFDGTQSLSGDISVANDCGVVSSTIAGGTIQIIGIGGSNLLSVGADACILYGVATNIYGKNIRYIVGNSLDTRVTAMTITDSGNVELAGVNNAYTKKLAVGVGGAHIIAITSGLPSLGTPAAGSLLVGSTHYGLQICTNTNDEASFIQAQRFNSADAKTLNLNPRGGAVNVGGNLAPNANNSLSLGTSSYCWSELHTINAYVSSNLGGIIPSGTTNRRWVIVHGLGGLYIQSSSYDGKSATGIINMTGYNATILTSFNVRSVLSTFSDRVLIGGATDDGSTALQVAGKASVSSLAVTGTSTFGGQSTFNAGIIVPSSQTVKIGEATLSYENGALKVDKNFFAEGEVASGKVAEEGTGGNTPSGSGLEIKTFDIASTTENQMVELSHNLGTRDVVVQIFENSQSSNYQQVFADVYYVDTAKVAINFGAAQTVPHRVIIMG